MSSMPQSINHPVMEKKTSIIGTITGGRIRKRSGLLGLFSNSKVYPLFLNFVKIVTRPKAAGAGKAWAPRFLNKKPLIRGVNGGWAEWAIAGSGGVARRINSFG